MMCFTQSVTKDVNGNRVHNKNQACYMYYCGELKTKISKHLLVCHSNEMEVVHIASLPRNSKERQKEIKLLCNKGNYYHNLKVLSTGEEEIILVRRPGEADCFDLDHYGPCPYCLGFN